MPKAVAVLVPSASLATIMLLVVLPVVSTSSMPLPAALISAVMPSGTRSASLAWLMSLMTCWSVCAEERFDDGRVAVAIGQVEVAQLPESRCRR